MPGAIDGKGLYEAIAQIKPPPEIALLIDGSFVVTAVAVVLVLIL